MVLPLIEPQYLQGIVLLASGYAVVSASEMLVFHRCLAGEALLSWENRQLDDPNLASGPWGRVLTGMYRYPNVRWLYALQLLLGLLQILLIRQAPHPSILGLLVATWLVSQRTIVGQDGADQMALLVLVATTCMALVPTPLVRLAACLFLAGQCVASYAIAGFAKIGEAKWRNGEHLAAVFGTDAYGTPPIGAFLARHRRLSSLLSIGFIGFECLFALALVGPRPIALVFLGTGLVFHLANAAVMGLNTFVFSFVATYPAILALLSIRPW